MLSNPLRSIVFITSLRSIVFSFNCWRFISCWIYLYGFRACWIYSYKRCWCCPYDWIIELIVAGWNNFPAQTGTTHWWFCWVWPHLLSPPFFFLFQRQWIQWQRFKLDLAMAIEHQSNMHTTGFTTWFPGGALHLERNHQHYACNSEKAPKAPASC